MSDPGTTISLTGALSPEVRRCGYCERSLGGYRRHARYCGAPCRAAASRERATHRALSGALEPFATALAQSRAETAQKRTRRAVKAGKQSEGQR